ncbi:hypothetical protein ACVB78_23150, partial [Priestia aryabhattai]
MATIAGFPGKGWMNRNEKRTCTVNRSRVGKSYGSSSHAGADRRRSPEVFIGVQAAVNLKSTLRLERAF